MSAEQKAAKETKLTSYVLVDRNIHFTQGMFRVLITRRPKNIYGGRFGTLADAQRKRDALEAAHPKGQIKGRRKQGPRRTTQLLRSERRAAGLCQECGTEAPKQGCVICQPCLTFSASKRRAKREALAHPS